jgi:hypothetical protein
MSRDLQHWTNIAKRRIRSILNEYRISYSRHLEIKISEAGPSNLRVEPSVLNSALKELIRDGVVTTVNNSPKIIGAPDFGRPGDQARLRAFLEWRNLFVSTSNNDPLCGLVLEYLLFESVKNSPDYWVLGGGPSFDNSGLLHKPKGSEILSFDGKRIFKADDGAGFDLFIIDKKNHVPIGIEAKNIREWVYPASYEVWRMIARACTLECLPVLAARKISYITTAGLFSQFGILGFQTHFQYFASTVQKQTKYQFKDKVIDKNRLGFADIKLIKKKDQIPNHFYSFFNNTLLNNSLDYYKMFMKNQKLLMKYAIDYGLAEDKLNGKARFELYSEFKEEASFEDPMLHTKTDGSSA